MQALLLLDGRPLGKLVAPALEWSTEPGAPPGLSLRFTRLVEAPVPAAAAAVRDSAAEPARQPRASAAQPQPLRLPVDGGFAQRTFRVQVVGRRHGAPAVAPRAYDVHGRDLVAGLSVQRQWQQYQQRHQAARTSAGQPVSAANFAHSSTLTVESGACNSWVDSARWLARCCCPWHPPTCRRLAACRAVGLLSELA